MGEPQSRSVSGTFRLTVLRNQFPPEILNLPETINVSESTQVSTADAFLYEVQARDNDTTVSSIIYTSITMAFPEHDSN